MLMFIWGEGACEEDERVALSVVSSTQLHIRREAVGNFWFEGDMISPVDIWKQEIYHKTVCLLW
jgi:hypothetical protein